MMCNLIQIGVTSLRHPLKTVMNGKYSATAIKLRTLISIRPWQMGEALNRPRCGARGEAQPQTVKFNSEMGNIS